MSITRVPQATMPSKLKRTLSERWISETRNACRRRHEISEEIVLHVVVTNKLIAVSSSTM